MLCDSTRQPLQQRRSGRAHGEFGHGQPDLPPPETVEVDADELRRKAEKARIRARILREEAEHWELELEVRSELREQMLRLPLPALGGSARGSESPVALSTGTMTAANSSLPVVALEVCCLLAFCV